jgi:hypothetical protein
MAQSSTRATSRSKEVLQFWEHRLGKKLTTRDAMEMQSNVEGVIALLAQWDRSDRVVNHAKPRKKHDAPTD